MLFFVDETWQEIAGVNVGALGGLAIEMSRYNYFCGEFFGLKRDVLGATELQDHEIGGNRCLSRRQFERKEDGKESKWLDSMEGLFDLLERHKVRTFVIWTSHPDLLTLRIPTTTVLTKPYKQLLFDMKALMEREAKKRLGSLNFDQRGPREDAATACAISNYLFRTAHGWRERFITIPNFTVSAVSPGLQAADVVTYLGAYKSNPKDRPELSPYLDRLNALRYEYVASGRKRRTMRQVG